MEIPKWMLEHLKEIGSRSDAAFTGCSLKTRPFARENCQRSEAPLGMIYRPRAADVPRFGRQHQSLKIIAMGPPTIPQLPYVFARRFIVDLEIGPVEETGCAKQQRLAILNPFAQQP